MKRSPDPYGAPYGSDRPAETACVGYRRPECCSCSKEPLSHLCRHGAGTLKSKQNKVPAMHPQVWRVLLPDVDSNKGYSTRSPFLTPEPEARKKPMPFRRTGRRTYRRRAGKPRGSAVRANSSATTPVGFGCVEGNSLALT